MTIGERTYRESLERQLADSDAKLRECCRALEAATRPSGTDEEAATQIASAFIRSDGSLNVLADQIVAALTRVRAQEREAIAKDIAVLGGAIWKMLMPENQKARVRRAGREGGVEAVSRREPEEEVWFMCPDCKGDCEHDEAEAVGYAPAGYAPKPRPVCQTCGGHGQVRGEPIP